MSEYASKRQASALPGSLHPHIIPTPSLTKSMSEGQSLGRLPDPLLGQTSPSTHPPNPGGNAGPSRAASCSFPSSGTQLTSYYPLRSSSSNEESRLRSTWDDAELEDDEIGHHPSSSKHVDSYSYSSGTSRITWSPTAFDQPTPSSSSSQFHTGALAYPTPSYSIPLNASDYGSSAAFTEPFEQGLVYSALTIPSQGVAVSVPHTISHERHNRRDIGVNADLDPPRPPQSREASFHTRPQYPEVQYDRLPRLSVEHFRALPRVTSPYSFPGFHPPPNAGQWTRAEDDEPFPALPPYEERKSYREVDFQTPYALKRSSTFPTTSAPDYQFRTDFEVPRIPSPSFSYPGSELQRRHSEEFIRSEIEAPAPPKRTEAPSKPRLKPVHRLEFLEEDEDDVPRKIPRKTLIACGFCRRRKLKCDGQRPMCRNCIKRTEQCAYAASPRRRGPGKAPKGSKKLSKARASASAQPGIPVPPGQSDFTFQVPTPGLPAPNDSSSLKPSGVVYRVQDAHPLISSESPGDQAGVRDPASIRTERDPRHGSAELDRGGVSLGFEPHSAVEGGDRAESGESNDSRGELSRMWLEEADMFSSSPPEEKPQMVLDEG